MAALLIPISTAARSHLEYITFGPMLHWNFGSDEFKSFSYGLEAAYWKYERDPQGGGFLRNLPRLDKPGFGLAIGFDVDRKSFRYYLEPELGMVMAGVSCGPVLEMPHKGGPSRIGVQAEGWVNAIVGADFRYKRLGGENFQSLGLYGKLGTVVTGGNED